jgi:hypothetical protein
LDDPRYMLEVSNQDWSTRAKCLKNELERQKVHSSNLVVEFKANLENKEIEWRQKHDRLQKQFDVLTDKYASKCMEARDKDNLLKRYILSK